MIRMAFEEQGPITVLIALHRSIECLIFLTVTQLIQSLFKNRRLLDYLTITEKLALNLNHSDILFQRPLQIHTSGHVSLYHESSSHFCQ